MKKYCTFHKMLSEDHPAPTTDCVWKRDKTLFTIEELRKVALDSNHDQMVKVLAAYIADLREEVRDLKRATRKIFNLMPKTWIEKVTTDGTRKGTHVETITIDIDREEIKQLQTFLNPEENE